MWRLCDRQVQNCRNCDFPVIKNSQRKTRAGSACRVNGCEDRVAKQRWFARGADAEVFLSAMQVLPECGEAVPCLLTGRAGRKTRVRRAGPNAPQPFAARHPRNSADAAQSGNTNAAGEPRKPLHTGRYRGFMRRKRKQKHAPEVDRPILPGHQKARRRDRRRAQWLNSRLRWISPFRRHPQLPQACLPQNAFPLQP